MDISADTHQSSSVAGRNIVSESSLLHISDLQVYFETGYGTLRAVDGVSLTLDAGETLALVGESGCGKTVTGFSVLKLLESPPAKYAGGKVLFRGRDLLRLNESSLRRIRGREISIVFQEPMSSLNPIMTIGDQIVEALLAHERVSRREARDRALRMLRRVGIPAPELRFNEYPHQLSGGMKQRAMIASALICRPAVLIADEPTTALDVTIQAQILDLISDLKNEFGMSVLLITHDLGVVAETSDRVAVMYAGKIVETATVSDLFESPGHPYTQGLFRSLPDLRVRKAALEPIPGSVPSPLYFPTGCRFRTRCPLADDVCLTEPPLRDFEPGHKVACHFAGEVGTRAGA